VLVVGTPDDALGFALAGAASRVGVEPATAELADVGLLILSTGPRPEGVATAVVVLPEVDRADAR
jgi:hypothetical protein